MEYRSSGHGELMGKAEPALVAVDEVLSVYGDGVAAARRAYVRALEVAAHAGWRDAAPGFLPWWKRESALGLAPFWHPSGRARLRSEVRAAPE